MHVAWLNPWGSHRRVPTATRPAPTNCLKQSCGEQSFVFISSKFTIRQFASNYTISSDPNQHVPSISINIRSGILKCSATKQKIVENYQISHVKRTRWRETLEFKHRFQINTIGSRVFGKPLNRITPWLDTYSKRFKVYRVTRKWLLHVAPLQLYKRIRRRMVSYTYERMTH